LLRERHADPVFGHAIEETKPYQRTDPHSSTQSNSDNGSTLSAAPLFGFFELVQIGDTFGRPSQTKFKDARLYLDESSTKTMGSVGQLTQRAAMSQMLSDNLNNDG
jgi:hypothetical protein